MDPLPARILATILQVAEPGATDGSRVAIDDCSADKCATVERLTGKAATLDFEWLNGSAWPGWTRAETKLEGMDRWVTYAHAAARVVEGPPSSWDRVAWDGDALVRALTVIARHESALWRGVATGNIRGKAGEVCYAQIHPVNFERLGVTAEDLLGLDVESVARCLTAAVDLLGRATRHCGTEPIVGRRYDGGVAWFGQAIVAYARGSGCATAEEWIESRVAMFGRLTKKAGRPIVLDADARLAYVMWNPPTL